MADAKVWRMGTRYRATAVKCNGRYPEGELIAVGKQGVKGNQSFAILKDGDNEFEVDLDKSLVEVKSDQAEDPESDPVSF